MKNKSRIEYQKGQTLITLLIFVVVAVTITTAATMVLLNSAQNASKIEVGTSALNVAQSGIENAMMRLLRNPNYTGETLTVGTGTAVVVVTPPAAAPTPFTIISTGTLGRSVRKIKVNAGYSGVQLVITPPWQEIP